MRDWSESGLGLDFVSACDVSVEGSGEGEGSARNEYGWLRLGAGFADLKGWLWGLSFWIDNTNRSNSSSVR